ncbi:MAG: proliferating cell nuclear antigen (pcna) [Desulfurococcales archaeon]|nr:proliferating cell nuclear antigen (pcna) [Desulfurococcales archaeon]
MFRFRFADARIWRYMIASIEKILDESVFLATSEGLSLRALDTSHVVMVDLFYPRDSFTEYEVEGDEASFGVSFSLLSKVLRRARKDDALELRVDESSIEVSFISRGVRRFRIPQINLALERLPEPRITYTVEARLMSTTFREAVKDLEPIADTITLQAVDEDILVMRGEGDIASGEAEFSLSRGSMVDYRVESPDTSSYALEYFSYMNQAAQAAEIVTVRYSADAPVRVDVEYQDGGRLTFYVSPRID